MKRKKVDDSYIKLKFDYITCKTIIKIWNTTYPISIKLQNMMRTSLATSLNDYLHSQITFFKFFFLSYFDF